MRRGRILGLCLVGGLSCAGADGACPEFSAGGSWFGVELVDQQSWSTVESAADDPFADMGRPEEVTCAESFGWSVVNTLHGREVDIDLFDCDWFSLEQPLAIDVPACTPMRVGFRHFDLTAPEPADAYMAVSIGGEIIWDQVVEIPGGEDRGMADVYEVDFPASRDYVAGEQVVIHVHNHGENSYVFAGLVADLGDS